jgi:NADH dehydrogenase
MILRDLAGQPRHPFAYVDKGQMATIGRSRAIAQVRRVTLTGRLAWEARIITDTQWMLRQ